MKTINTTAALFLATTLTVSAALSFNLNDISTEYNGGKAEESAPSSGYNYTAPAKKPVIKKSVKKLNETQQVTAPDAELKATFDMMTQEIVRVQAVYDSGQYGQALNESKKLLDTVRIRTGIHPKAKITEKIEIRNVFEEGESATTFNGLSQEKREAIALAVLNHRGGLYLDILNQTKRASLIYIKSLYMRLKKDGSLLNEDISKIKTDLLAIMAIKIDLVQYDQDIRFSVKDSDVANSDQNYLFNREIKIFALGNKDLAWTEETFDQELGKEFVQSVTNRYSGRFLNDPVTCGPSVERNSPWDINRAMELCKTKKMSTLQCAISLEKNSPLGIEAALQTCEESGR